ncbi:MAG: 3'-5' exonuclease, partial [Campylobacterota bacterium]|nr:3'-5' exonuclease [Campylobacterota bacterium]
ILSGNAVSENGSFFFVGDVKQSIYRFRGGVSALFGAVKEECHTEVEPLLTNYRSQKEVIEFVNRTFIDKIKKYAPQNVRADAQAGYVEVINSEELLEETIKQVERLIYHGAYINEVAVLCATNGDGEVIKQRLQDENIEVVTETTTKLINQKSVKAVLEYLKYLYFGEDIYRYNFFALINQELCNIAKINLTKIKLLDLVKEVITEYKLFGDDFHLIRFLDIIRKYEDIEALLFEYERLDASGAASDLNGVRILTIHKSKGLEYEHVIVMDRLKKAPPARDAIIYEYDGIKLKDVYLRTKGRDAIDAKYANALAKEKSLSREDSLNALYVAFTRARENLFVILKPKDSAFDILNLATGSSGELVCNNFDTDTKSVQVLKDIKYRELYYGTQSDILKLEESSDEDLKSINFGLALHYMLEMLGQFSLKSISNAKDMMINKYGYSLEDQELEDLESRVSMLLQNREFISLASGECYREKAIRYKNNLRYIDLLVKSDNGVWNVIDYKSSFAYQEHHLKQVRYYVDAVKKITGDEVKGYICYILKNEVKLVEVQTLNKP